MANVLKYIVDAQGEKIAVVVPLKAWNKINEEVAKLQKKLQVFASVKHGLSNIKDPKTTEKKLQTLKDFLKASHN